jgi:hypothetical protein
MPSPITAAVGKNGSGKTLALVERVIIPCMSKGMPVLSNVRVFASPNDRDLPNDEREPHPLWVPLVDPEQLVGPKGMCVVVDEIQSAFSSRESSSMPAAVLNDLMQLRKGDNVIAWSAPSWKRADIVLREVTLELILCSGHRPKMVPDKVWPQNRVMRWRYFDAQDFEEFNVGAAKSSRRDSIRPRSSRWYWRSRHVAQHLYDTYEPVERMSHADEYGVCVRCHGTRRRPACSCGGRDDPQASRRALAELRMAEVIERQRNGSAIPGQSVETS